MHHVSLFYLPLLIILIELDNPCWFSGHHCAHYRPNSFALQGGSRGWGHPCTQHRLDAGTMALAGLTQARWGHPDTGRAGHRLDGGTMALAGLNTGWMGVQATGAGGMQVTGCRIRLRLRQHLRLEIGLGLGLRVW